MLSHLRRRIGVLTAVAVLAALVPTLSTSPVGAAPAATARTAANLDAPATYLACPASANIPSAGFTDTTDTAVDCIKYYGITSGTTATTYSPTDSVSRWQMALYITRLLDVANVTLGTGADQGFTDISGKSAEIQTAINQIKQLGITTGVTATTYAPDNNVSRQEMALFIERMLDNLPFGPGGVSEAEMISAAATTYVNSNCAGADSCTGLYNYTDIDSGSVTVEASLAIKELFTLGIHDGVSATTFNPGSDMTRAAMATFLTAALNHTNVRPEGLHLQASNYSAATASNTPTMSVSYRDASFDPIASAPVDVHFWTNSTTEGNTNFLATGLCSTSYTAATSDSITECYIDTNETATDEYGNMTPTANGTAPVSTIYNGTDTYHAWTAAAGTTYDNDIHGEAAAPNTHSSVDVVATPAAAAVRCSADTPTNAKTATAAHTVKFATTTTFTCQVVNLTSGATAGSVASAGQTVKFERVQTFTTDSTGNQNGETLVSSNTIGTTDANGTVTFSVTGPADTTDTDVVTDAITITALSPLTAEYAYNTTASTSGHLADDATDLQMTLLYTDTTAAINSITTTQTASSGTPSTSGVTRSVTANAWDQYGDASPAQTITFTDSRTLPDNLGYVCSGETPTVCTTLTAHGLDVGDDLTVTSTGTADTSCTEGVAGTTLAAQDVVIVATVPSSTSFTIDDASGNDVGCGVASNAAGPLAFTTTSFDNAANNTRVTSTAGAATFSWVDTEADGGKDTVTATSGGKTSSKVYYALTTAASFAETGDGDGVLADNENVARIVEFDSTGNDMIVEITCAGGTGCTAFANTQTRVQYMQYTWDSNDHFANEATNALPNGTAATESAWETTGAALAAANSGAGSLDDVFMIDWASLSTGVSRFYTN